METANLVYSCVDSPELAIAKPMAKPTEAGAIHRCSGQGSPWAL